MERAQLAPYHPITLALNVIAPLFGCNFEVRSPRDEEFTNYDKFPALDYTIIDTQNAVYDKSKKVWELTQLVRLDYHIQENVNICYEDYKALEHVQDLQALMFSFDSKLRSIVQAMIDPKSILPTAIYNSDVVYNKYQFKLQNFVIGVYHRKKGDSGLTGASILFSLTFRDVDSLFCCIDDPSKLSAIVKEGSRSAELIENLTP